MKVLLIVTAMLEAATGVALLAAPSTVASALLGASLETPVAQSMARIAGAALLTIGVACWSARHEAGGRTARGIITGMVVYNCGAVVVLVHGTTVGGLSGIGLWPAAILHTALAGWCLACLASHHKK